MSLKRIKTIGSLGLLIVFLGICVAPSAAATTASSKWADSLSDPVVVDGEDWTDTEYNTKLQSLMGIHARQTCKDEKILLIGGYEQEDCMYDTAIGKIGKRGYLFLPKGETHGGYINKAQSQLFPTPNSDVYIEVVPDEHGSTLYFRDKNTVDVEYVTDENGQEIPLYEWRVAPRKQILQKDGTPWIIDVNILYSRVWYSENGRWMLLMDEHGFVVRIDLKNLSLLTLQAMLVSDGSDSFATLDISPDGGQIAVNLFGRPLRLLDANSCGQYETDRVVEPKMCSMYFLNTYISQASGNYLGIGNLPLFHSDTLLEYVMYNNGRYETYYIFAPGTYEQNTDYIALGDSYASGEGAHSYYEETNLKNINKCHLSRKSYPYLLGEMPGMQSSHSVACSGARIKNIIGPELIDRDLKDGRRTNQYNIGASSALGDRSPGYYLQEKHVQDVEPNVITLSIGGNDIGFSEKVTRCVLWSDTCYNSYEDREEIVLEIHSIYSKLVETYQSVKKDAAPGARIYVTGYPQIAYPNGACGLNVRLNKAEIQFSNHLVTYLNDVIEKATKRAGVTYVDIEQAFDGHRLCESDKQAVNGLTAGDDKFNLLGNESYHPNAFGHELIAATIQRETDNFMKKTPREDKAVTYPKVEDAYYLLDGIDRSGRRTLATRYNHDISTDFIVRGDNMSGKIYGANYNLKQHTQYRFVLTSTPVELGGYTTDSNGNIDFSVHIPKNIEPGFHTLHIHGIDTAGNEIDVYKQIYIAASSNDWDGDGIKNRNTPCKIVLISESTGNLDYNWCNITRVAVPTNLVLLKDANINNTIPYQSLPSYQKTSKIIGQGDNTTDKTNNSLKDAIRKMDSKVLPKPRKEEFYIWLSFCALLAAIISVLILSMIRYRKRKQPYV